MYDIRFYANSRGDEPVRKFIEGLPEKQQNKVIAYIKKWRSLGTTTR